MSTKGRTMTTVLVFGRSAQISELLVVVLVVPVVLVLAQHR